MGDGEQTPGTKAWIQKQEPGDLVENLESYRIFGVGEFERV